MSILLVFVFADGLNQNEFDNAVVLHNVDGAIDAVMMTSRWG
jgi:hypothetical protein